MQSIISSARLIVEMIGWDGLPEPYEDYKRGVAALLKAIDPNQGLGTALYLAIARLSWNCYLESVALRVNLSTRQVEVFMTQRDDSDPDWKWYWHVPGTALRPRDVAATAEARLVKEYGVPMSSFERVGDTGFDWCPEDDERRRGPGVSFVSLTELGGDPMVNDRRGWFPVDDLPGATVPAHAEKIIPMAVKVFVARHRID